MSITNFLIALILIYGLWALTIRFGLGNLNCWRKVSRPTFFEGEEGELIEVVRNDRPFIIPWVRIESYISPHLRLGRQDNLHVSGQTHYCSLFTLMPYQQIRRKHRVRFLHRGIYDLGNAALTSGDLLGLFRFTRPQDLRTPVTVYPRLLDTDEIPLPVSRAVGEMVRRHQLLQDPFLVRGIRPYQPGDPVRDIHWAATARTGETQIRVRDYTARTRLLVVLNVQPEELQLSSYISEHDEIPVEEGIRLAATVCIQALRAGLSAGFAANMPMGDGNVNTVILPRDGSAQEEELLAAFARLTVSCTDKFPVFLDSLSEQEGMDILILSQYDSNAVQNSIRKLRQKGNQVTFQLIKGGDR